jgi:hypothetical protein
MTGGREAGKLGCREAGRLGGREAGKLGSWEVGKLGSWEAGKRNKEKVRRGEGVKLGESITACNCDGLN